MRRLRMVGAIRVAFLTTVVPVAQRSGGEIVAFAFVDALRRAGHDVQVVGWLAPGAEPPAEPWVRVAGHRVIETAEAPAATKAAWLARAIARRQPFSVAKYIGRGYRRAAAAAVRDADLTIINTAQAPVSPPARRPLVHIAFNVEHDLYAQAAQRSSGAGRIVRQREAGLVERVERRLSESAAAVWCLTEADARRFTELGARRAPVFPVPGRKSTAVDADARQGVALIGNWTWEPNAVGLRWFGDEVAARLDPALQVQVAGIGATEALPDPGRLRLLGRVADADAFLAGARVVAVPALAGGGIQVKTLDAIGAGAWIVTTPVGVRGLDELPASVRVEETPDAFAAAIQELARDPVTAQPSAEGIQWARDRARRFDALVTAEALAAIGDR